MLQAEITDKIIKAFYKVNNTLGYGFLEKVYENAMTKELRKMGFKVLQQQPIKVYYDDEVVGEFSADLFVEDTVVVELKSVQHTIKDHELQLVNYLKGLKRDIGLLINFSPSGVEVKRKFRRPVQET